MKAYEIVTKPYQDFSFYSRNGIITLCSDQKFPYIGGNSMYDGAAKKWIQIDNPMKSLGSTTIVCTNQNINTYRFAPDRVICPSWFVEKKYYKQNIIEQLEPLVKWGIETFNNDNFNIFIFKKHLKIENNKELLSVGVCAREELKGIRCHSEFTKECQKILALKVFW